MLFSKGVIRLYAYFGFFVGFFVCRITLSKLFMLALNGLQSVVKFLSYWLNKPITLFGEFMQKVLSTMRKAIEKYKLIENGDKIAIGVSGGKDSLVLLKALKDFQKFNVVNYEIVAVTIDNYSGKEDYSGLKNFCKEIWVDGGIRNKLDIQTAIFHGASQVIMARPFIHATFNNTDYSSLFN
jgi:hypothetical protein